MKHKTKLSLTWMSCLCWLGTIVMAAGLPSFKPMELASAGDVPYPPVSMADGVVVLRVATDRTGKVTATNVLRDIPSLTGAATASVQSWKFRAASRADGPSASAMTVAVVFRPGVLQALPPAFEAVQPRTESNYAPAGIQAAAFPEYPVNSVASGTVVLQVVVDEEGRVGAVETIRGIPSLAVYARRALEAWRFEAATINGKRVASKVAVAFVFRPLFTETPHQLAWNILRRGVSEKNTRKRAQAVRALRLLPGNRNALEMAQRALQDHQPDVEAAAATALGLMSSKESIPGLKTALSNKKPSVVLAAAHALQVLGDPAGDEVFCDVLTGERKSGDGLVAQGMDTMRDRKKIARLSFEGGLGFIPYADIGYSAAKALRKDDASPVRAAAARSLVKDQDPRIEQALVRAASDKSWIVRAAALLTIAKQGHPEFLNRVAPAMLDKNEVVRYTAAAAVIRLTTPAESSEDDAPTHSKE